MKEHNDDGPALFFLIAANIIGFSIVLLGFYSYLI